MQDRVFTDKLKSCIAIILALSVMFFQYNSYFNVVAAVEYKDIQAFSLKSDLSKSWKSGSVDGSNQKIIFGRKADNSNGILKSYDESEEQYWYVANKSDNMNLLQLFSTGTDYYNIFTNKTTTETSTPNRWSVSNARSWLNGDYKRDYFKGEEPSLLKEEEVTTKAELVNNAVAVKDQITKDYFYFPIARRYGSSVNDYHFSLSSSMIGDVTKNLIPREYWPNGNNWSRTPDAENYQNSSAYTLYYNKTGVGSQVNNILVTGANVTASGPKDQFKYTPLANIDATKVVFASSALAGETSKLKKAKDGMYLKIKSENYGGESDFKIYNDSIYNNGNNMFIKYTNAKAGDYITICITNEKSQSYTASFKVEKDVSQGDNTYGVAIFDVSEFLGTDFTTKVWCEIPSNEGYVNKVSSVHTFTGMINDNTAPTIKYISTEVSNGTHEGNGWYSGGVEVTVKVEDSQSGVNPETVKMKVNNVEDAISPVKYNYNQNLYTFEFGNNSKDGEYELYVTASDFVGNITDYKKITTVKIDKTAPSFDGFQLNQDGDVMKVKANTKDGESGIDRVEVRQLDKSGAPIESTKAIYKPGDKYAKNFEFSFDVDANDLIKENGISYQIKAYDAVFNETIENQTFSIKKPKITDVVIENKEEWKQEKKVTFSLKGEDGGELGYQIDKESIEVVDKDGNTYEITKSDEGINVFSFVADKIGNYDIKVEFLRGHVAQETVYVDKINDSDPIVEFESVSTFLPTKDAVTLNFNVELGEAKCPVDKVKVYKENSDGKYEEITDKLTINKPENETGDGTYSFNVEANGKYKLEIIDASGKTGEAEHEIDNIYGGFEIKEVDVEYLGLGISKITMKKPEEINLPNKIESATIVINGETINMTKVSTGTDDNEYEFVAEHVPHSGDFKITAKDTATNEASYNGTIATNPPKIEDVEISDKDTWTKEKTLTFKVTDVDGESVRASVTGITEGSLQKVETGDKYTKFKCKIIENGNYTIEAEDNSGRNAKPVNATIVKIDTAAPNMVGSIEYDKKWTKDAVEVTIDIKDEQSGLPEKGGLVLKYTENGNEKTLDPTSVENVGGSNNQKKYTFSIKNNGNYTPSATDTVGNQVNLEAFEVKNIDTTAPKIEVIDANIINENETPKRRIVFTVTDNESGVNEESILIEKEGSEERKDVNKSSDGNKYYFDVESSEGKVNYTISAEDNAGNIAQESVKVNWGLPVISDPEITPEGWAKEKTVKFTVESEAGVDRGSIYYVKDANAVRDTLIIEGNETNFTVSFPASSEGKYTLYVKDKSGNEASKEAEVQEIDTQAPTLVSYEVTNINGNTIDSPTNQDVYLSVELIDTQSGVNQGSIELERDGIKLEKVSENRFKIEQNGTYKLIAEDNAGNKFEGNAANGGLIEINLIDKGKPIISENPTNVEAIGGEHKKKVYFKVTNEGVSEVDKNSIKVKNENNVVIPVIDTGANDTYYFEITQGGTFKINANNTAGENADERTYSIEFIAPVIIDVSVAPEGWARSKRIDFKVTDGEGSGIDKVEIYLGDSKKGDAKKQGDNYYFEVLDELDEAGKTYRIVASDKNANTSSENVAVAKIDRTAPDIRNVGQNPGSGTFTKEDVTVTFEAIDNLSGVNENQVLFKSEYDDTWQLCTKGNENKWSFKASRNGKYYVKVSDNVDNVNSSYAEDANPLITISNIDKDLPIISDFNVISTENGVKTVQFEVYAASGIEEVILKNGGNQGQSLKLKEGSETRNVYTFEDAANSANHEYTVTATSKSGNTAEKIQIIEWSAPEIKSVVITPAGKEVNGYAKERKITVEVRDESTVKAVKATLNGKGIDLNQEGEPKVDLDDPGKRLYTFSVIVNEEGTYKIVATDLCGNDSAESEAKVEKLDNEAPTIDDYELYDAETEDELTSDSKLWTKNNVKVELNVKDTQSGMGNVLVLADRVVWAKANFENEKYVFTATENGTYYVMASDALGNSTNGMYEVEVSCIDRQAPTESEYQVIDETNGEKTIKFKLSDTQSGVNEGSVKYRLDGGEEQTCGKDGEFYTFNVKKPEGDSAKTNLNITIMASDKAGNQYTAQKLVTWQNPVVKKIEILPGEDDWSAQKEIEVYIESSIQISEVIATNNIDNNDKIEFKYNDTHQSNGTEVFVYSAIYEKALDDAGKTYKVIAKDMSNNSSSDDNSTFTLKRIDKAVPNINNISLQDKAGNTLLDDAWTNDDVTVKAEVQDNESGVKKLEYKGPGEEQYRECQFPSGSNEGDSNIEFSLVATVNGTYTLRATDMVGNPFEKEVMVKIDREAVTIDDLKVETNKENADKIDINFKVTAGSSGVKEVTYKVGENGESITSQEEGIYKITIDKGENINYTIKATNNAGTKAEITRTQDWNAPIVEIESVTDENSWAKSKMVFVKAYDDDGDDVELKITCDNIEGPIVYNSLEGHRYSFIATKEGEYKVIAIDDYGNKAEATKEISKIDHTAPSIKENSLKIEAAEDSTSYTEGDKTYVNGKIKVSFTLVDSQSGINEDKIVLEGKTSKLPIYPNAKNNEGNGEVSVEFLIDKNDTYMLTSEDEVGNKMTDNDRIKIGVDGAEFYIDSSVPEVSLISKEPSTWTNAEVKVIVEAKDPETGIKAGSVKYKKSDQGDWTVCTGESSDNQYSFTVGQNGIYYVQAKNNLEIESKILEVKIDNIDKEAPTIEVKDITSNGTNKTVVFKVDDTLSGVNIDDVRVSYGSTTLRVPDGNLEYDDNSKEFKFKVDNAGAEEIDVNINAKDNAGNEAEETKIKLEWKVPVIKSINVSAVGDEVNGYAKERKVEVKVSDESEVSKVNAYLNGEIIELTKEGEAEVDPDYSEKKVYTFIFTTDIMGTYEIMAYDAVDNESDSTKEPHQAVVEKIDNTPPMVEHYLIYDENNDTEPLNGETKRWSKDSVIVRLDVTDDESGVKKVLYSGNSTTWQESKFESESGDYTFKVSQNGMYYIKTIDQLDNSNDGIYEIRINHIDDTPPRLVSYSAILDNNNKINLIIKVRDDESGICSIMYSTDSSSNFKEVLQEFNVGTPEVEIGLKLDEEGIYYLKLVDAVGNVSTEQIDVKVENKDSSDIGVEELGLIGKTGDSLIKIGIAISIAAIISGIIVFALHKKNK